MKPVIITKGQWTTLREKMHQEYPKSVFLIRERMKQKLGFLPRDHRHYDDKKGYYVEQVHLDFYSENKKTMFLLKYAEVLNAHTSVF